MDFTNYSKETLVQWFETLEKWVSTFCKHIYTPSDKTIQINMPYIFNHCQCCGYSLVLEYHKTPNYLYYNCSDIPNILRTEPCPYWNNNEVIEGKMKCGTDQCPINTPEWLLIQQNLRNIILLIIETIFYQRDYIRYWLNTNTSTNDIDRIVKIRGNKWTHYHYFIGYRNNKDHILLLNEYRHTFWHRIVWIWHLKLLSKLRKGKIFQFWKTTKLYRWLQDQAYNHFDWFISWLTDNIYLALTKEEDLCI